MVTHEDQDEVDDDLIARVKAKEPDALAQFISDNQGRLIGFIRSITGEHLLAIVELDDLFQEVSTAALTGLETAPLRQYEPMQWLQELARRRVVDAHRFHFDAQRRDANRQQSLQAGGADSGGNANLGLEALLVASMTSPSAAVSRDIRMQRMSDAIGLLTEEQRTAIRLRYAEGLPTKEVAKQIGKSDVATRVLLSRSMRELEKLLSDVKPSR